MNVRLRKWWPVFKVLFTLAILITLGRRFALDLSNEELWKRPVHAPWLILSGVLYVLGLGSSAYYWYRLLMALGQHPSFPRAVRAHYLGQMGKYLPGKAWALLVRSAIVRGPEVRVGVAVLTSFFEVLTSMCCGVLLAAVLFGLHVPSAGEGLQRPTVRELLLFPEPKLKPMDPRVGVLLAALMTLAIGAPLAPPLFNRLAQRIARPFRSFDSLPLPHIPMYVLMEGAILTAPCWFFFGTSLWAMLRGVGIEVPLTAATLAHHTAVVAVAYVAGFLILLVPSGLGVREYFLLLFLVPEVFEHGGLEATEARAVAALVVVLLRLVWTASELVVVAVLYWIPASPVPKLELPAEP